MRRMIALALVGMLLCGCLGFWDDFPNISWLNPQPQEGQNESITATPIANETNASAVQAANASANATATPVASTPTPTPTMIAMPSAPALPAPPKAQTVLPNGTNATGTPVPTERPNLVPIERSANPEYDNLLASAEKYDCTFTDTSGTVKKFYSQKGRAFSAGEPFSFTVRAQGTAGSRYVLVATADAVSSALLVLPDGIYYDDKSVQGFGGSSCRWKKYCATAADPYIDALKNGQSSQLTCMPASTSDSYYVNNGRPFGTVCDQTANGTDCSKSFYQ